MASSMVTFIFEKFSSQMSIGQEFLIFLKILLFGLNLCARRFSTMTNTMVTFIFENFYKTQVLGLRNFKKIVQNFNQSNEIFKICSNSTENFEIKMICILYPKYPKFSRGNKKLPIKGPIKVDTLLNRYRIKDTKKLF